MTVFGLKFFLGVSKMPRLIGRNYNPLPSLVLLFMIGAIFGGTVVAEYSGLIDYIPYFGRVTAKNPD